MTNANHTHGPATESFVDATTKVVRPDSPASTLVAVTSGEFERRVYVRADGSVRIVDTCSCRAFRSTEIEVNGLTFKSDWAHLESERAS